MSHSSVHEDVVQHKSMNECSEIKYTSADFPAQGVGSNGPCVGSNGPCVGSNGPCVGSMSIGTQFMHGAHF